MKNIPHKQVTFCTDATKDIVSFFGFVSDAVYDDGRNLEWAVFNKYPASKKWFRKGSFIGRRTDVVQFVKGVYARHTRDIATNLALYERNWRVIEPKFYKLTEELFGTYPWPKGKYIAYPTIWGVFPRSLEDKTFQVPYRFRNKRYVSVVVAHELLHFMFYAYFYKHYSRYHHEDYGMLSWHVSEIFNTVVQNSTPWLAVFGLPNMGYPEHEKIVAKLSRTYGGDKTWNVDDLIKDIVVSAQKLVC